MIQMMKIIVKLSRRKKENPKLNMMKMVKLCIVIILELYGI